jgi:hypothetical protein
VAWAAAANSAVKCSITSSSTVQWPASVGAAHSVSRSDA